MVKRTEEMKRIDKFIGNKVYELRIVNGMSRKKLANKINVSSVQLQKYEEGVNSINANKKIIKIALALGQKVSYFFEGIEEARKETTLTKKQRICLEIAKNFRKITLPEHRKAINNLVKVLAKHAA